MEILGVTIDNLTRDEIIGRVKYFLDEPQFHQIATINPEFLLEAEKNPAFRTVLQNCDLRIADGVGISLAMLCKGEKLKYRFPGADLMLEILNIAHERKLGIYLAIRKDGLSSYEEIKSALQKKYPTLQINGSEIDSKIPNTRYQIPNTIILCNFGAPTQERFLQSLKDQPLIRLTMGVGGSFDYLTGKLKRAPRWMRDFGLEWLWRLMKQPKRIKRIWNAVIVFPFRALF